MAWKWIGNPQNNNLLLMQWYVSTNHLSKTSESFIAWDDNEKRRQKISLTFKDIVFKHPEDLNLSKVKEAFITPGISLMEIETVVNTLIK